MLKYFLLPIWLIVSLTGIGCQRDIQPNPNEHPLITFPGTNSVDFGPNVLIIDPSMPAETIQASLDAVYTQQRTAQFGDGRYAFLFKPGTYSLDFNVGFYTHGIGLGSSPDDVVVKGAVHSDAWLPKHNATCNFWRAIENISVIPNGGIMRWAVSQACPVRRLHVKGNLVLHDQSGWASGGFLADSLIDEKVASGSQQQWFSRNTEWAEWIGANWNMVFTGIKNAPAESWPEPPFTVVDKTPVIREKPYLTIHKDGKYFVFVPSLRNDTIGPSWSKGTEAGYSIPIDQFYIAKSSVDTVESINLAIGMGKNLLLTPGIYHLSNTISISRSNTVVLGIGMPTLSAENGKAAMSVADVDGVKIAGVLFDAGEENSPVQLEIGPAGSSLNHSKNPISLHDLYFRVGGAHIGNSSVSLKINCNDVIGDHFWVWRADHGTNNSVGWSVNRAANGLVVNGSNVTLYGLFVEHYQQYQTLWTGNNGRVYFYQCELPYDVPDQQSWILSNQAADGYSAYKVADSVKNHEAWGLGVYSVFKKNGVNLESAVEAPAVPGVKFHHLVDVFIGKADGSIRHIINGDGDCVSKTNFKSAWPNLLSVKE